MKASGRQEGNVLRLKTPITYYGGKQKLVSTILPLIPEHTLYCEPFIGGGAVFWAKEPSGVEVINDTNRELINFYRVIQQDFVSLEKEVNISLHSRDLHRKARVINENPDMFSDLKRAWAIWVLAAQSFSSILDGSWGYDKKEATTSKKINNKRNQFTEELAIRLQQVQIECADALQIIISRDIPTAFFYCDPPYYNSDMGHYDGYTEMDFDALLQVLSKLQGRFLLSSYPSKLLSKYTEVNGWSNLSFETRVSVNKGSNSNNKMKVEMLTANYQLKAV